MLCRNRQGHFVSTYDGQGRLVSFLYERLPGRILLWVLVRPWVSRLVGWFLNRRLSRLLIRPFIRKNHIDMSQFEDVPYRSYNAFFSRRIRPEMRPVDPDPDSLLAPCDAKVTVCRIGADAHFTIKGTDYTPESLLRDAVLADRYRGGWLVLLRLTVDDYHRYVYPADGEREAYIRIPGVYHTVQPAAAENRPIYKENTREYTVLHTADFGDVLMMEVGALLVGRIVNDRQETAFSRGEEKGHFAFGGSTVILMTEPGQFAPETDLLQNTADGYETVVKMGESLGRKETAPRAAI